MSRIDNFLNSIYKNLEGEEQEKKELKEEMRVHLIEKVNEYQQNGKTEEEAIILAIEEFGDKNTITNGLKEFFNIPKISIGQYLWYLLMFFVYFGYVFLVNYQLNMSEIWLSKNGLTIEEVERINQLGMWINTFELTFIILFAIKSIFHIVKYRKNKKEKKVVKQFIMINIILFVVIVGLSFVLTRFADIPIGNLLLPLFLPSIIFIALLTYMIWGLLNF